MSPEAKLILLLLQSRPLCLPERTRLFSLCFQGPHKYGDTIGGRDSFFTTGGGFRGFKKMESQQGAVQSNIIVEVRAVFHPILCFKGSTAMSSQFLVAQSVVRRPEDLASLGIFQESLGCSRLPLTRKEIM